MVSPLLFIAGLAALAIARGLRRSRMRNEAWRRVAARASGTVKLEVATDPTTRNPSLDRFDPLIPRITFRAADHHLYSFQDPHAGLKEGETVIVLYDPASPSSATLEPHAGSARREWAMRILGLILIVTALASYALTS